MAKLLDAIGFYFLLSQQILAFKAARNKKENTVSNHNLTLKIFFHPDEKEFPYIMKKVFHIL